MIQGPYKTNQAVLANSKFMENVVDVLGENGKLFKIIVVQQKKQDAKLLGVIFKQVQTQKKEWQSFNQMGQPKEQQGLKRMKMMDQNKPCNLTLHRAKLARLELKALTSLVSLVECCDWAILTRVLTNNIQYYLEEQQIILTEDEECYELYLYTDANFGSKQKRKGHSIRGYRNERNFKFDVDKTDEQQNELFGQLSSVELGRLSKIKQSMEDSNEN